MRYLYLCLYLSLCLSLSGCAAPQEVKQRYFWPPPPDEPRIEFIASYWSERDFPRARKRVLMEAVAGAEAVEGFKKPWGIASNGEGKVYIVDTNRPAVVIFDLKNYTVDMLGKGEYQGLLYAPVGIALDASGNIYVSDPKRNRVYSFTRDEKPLRTIGDDTTLNWPVGMAVDDTLGRLYVVNGRNHNIAVFSLDGKYLFAIGKRGEGDGELNFPTDVDTDSAGNIVVADSMNARVQVFDRDGKLLRKFGRRGDAPEEFQMIKGIAVSRNDNIYVTDARTDRILIFDKNGEPLTAIGGTSAVAETGKLTPGGFVLPQDIDIDENDTIYVVDSINKRFQVFQIMNEEWLKEHPIK